MVSEAAEGADSSGESGAEAILSSLRVSQVRVDTSRAILAPSLAI